MKGQMLQRIAALVIGMLLIAAVIVGTSVFRKRMAVQETEASDVPASVSEAAAGKIRGPFLLRETYFKTGGTNYVSFNVYYRHDDSEELWYVCGRMFRTDQVSSIAWANNQYDITVTMKDGHSEFFSYDGNNQWQ